MYLIARPYKQAQLLIKSLELDGIKSDYLPIIGIEYNEAVTNQLDMQLRQFDTIFLTSPTAIDVFVDKISHSNNRLKILLSGISYSSQIINNLPNLLVSYPVNGSGVNCLIAENLFDNCGKLAVVGGGEINPLLEKYLLEQNINYSFIRTYFRCNIGLANLAKLESLFLLPNISAIVVTSKEIVQFILECAAVSEIIKKRLFAVKIISIHHQITQYLLGSKLINIIQTKDASTQSIVNLIKDLENVRN